MTNSKTLPAWECSVDLIDPEGWPFGASMIVRAAHLSEVTTACLDNAIRKGWKVARVDVTMARRISGRLPAPVGTIAHG